MRKQFGEAVVDDSKKSGQASGASVWKEKKITCNNPHCKVHGYGHQLEKVNDTQVSHMHNSGGQFKSRVSNAYGAPDDLSMDSDDDVPVPMNKSEVVADSAVGSIGSSAKDILKPQRQPTQQNR